jgi:hypothetical protein
LLLRRPYRSCPGAQSRRWDGDPYRDSHQLANGDHYPESKRHSDSFADPDRHGHGDGHTDSHGFELTDALCPAFLDALDHTRHAQHAYPDQSSADLDAHPQLYPFAHKHGLTDGHPDQYTHAYPDQLRLGQSLY